MLLRLPPLLVHVIFLHFKKFRAFAEGFITDFMNHEFLSVWHYGTSPAAIDRVYIGIHVFPRKIHDKDMSAESVSYVSFGFELKGLSTRGRSYLGHYCLTSDIWDTHKFSFISSQITSKLRIPIKFNMPNSLEPSELMKQVGILRKTLTKMSMGRRRSRGGDVVCSAWTTPAWRVCLHFRVINMAAPSPHWISCQCFPQDSDCF